MKFAFATCVQLGLSCIEEIYKVGGKLTLIVTLQDNISRNKSGRVYLDNFCNTHNIESLKIKNINEEAVIAKLKEHDIDWFFIIGWSQIAKKTLLDSPKKGVLGIHPTLLPTGRGRAAIPWAIIKGIPETGVTLFKLDSGVDTGPILSQVKLPLQPDETATQLYDRVNEAHKTLLRSIWPQLINNTLEPVVQNELLATEWQERKPEDGRIMLNMDGLTVDRLVRGVTRPYPGAFLVINSKQYIIWAGKFHRNIDKTCIPTSFSNQPLWFTLTEGSFEATEWEVLEKS